MNDAIARTCGFATQAEQERLGRIYSALKTAIEEISGPMIETEVFTEREAYSSEYEWCLNQDAQRVSLVNDQGLVIWFKFDGSTEVMRWPEFRSASIVSILSLALSAIAEVK